MITSIKKKLTTQHRVLIWYVSEFPVHVNTCLLIEISRNTVTETPPRNAIKLEANDVKLWANLGVYLTMMHRCEEAKKTLQNAQKLATANRHVKQLVMLWNQTYGGR